MDIERADLAWAAEAALLTPEQADKLWRALEERRASDRGLRISPSTGVVEERPPPAVRARFDLVHVAWYAGSLLVIGALGWFATLGLDAWGGPGMLAIGLIYGTLFAVVGGVLWRGADLKLLGALLVSASVSMAPVAVYGLEKTLGLWPDHDPGHYRGFYDWVSGGWFAMEVASIIVGAIALRLVPFSFVAMPMAITVWFASMDAAPLLFDHPTDEDRAWTSVVVGVLTLAVAYALRLKKRADLNYWLEVFGLLAFEGGLLMQHGDALVPKLLFLLVQIGLALLGLSWKRNVFLLAFVVGSLAVAGLSLFGHRTLHFAFPGMCGAFLLVFAVYLQRRRVKGLAAYSFLVGAGVLAIAPYDAWGWHDIDESFLALYALWNLFFVVAGVFLRSRILTAVGALALATYLLHLADDVFKSSMVFPIVLVSLGICVIAGGVFLHRRRHAIDAFFDARVPAWLRAFRGD